ncbi:GNAT family N-acetyltransferase, partial [Cellulomonas sp. P5_C6]
VEWRCRTDNLRSIAVARRLGMVHEGVLREAWLVDGTFHDKSVWSLLSHEFHDQNRLPRG